MRLPDNREFADTDEDAVCRLAARAAHDLDNLLAAVVGHVAMALDSMQEAPCATRELESVRRAAQRATGLATRLLESSRRETRRGRSPDPARLLVVEDDAGVRRLIVRALEQAGFQVDAAGGAARALELLVDPEQRIDLLITDIVMPGIGGIELARRVARIRPGVPVLFVSGCAEDLVAPRAGGGAPQDLLLKPFAREDLLANVERLLSDAAGPDALASGSEAGQPGA
jgi:CheY-like chemotaxis protein